MIEDPREAIGICEKKCSRCQNMILAEDVGMFAKCRICRAFVEHPDSVTLAFGLNAMNAETCSHRRDPCLLRCGVERDRTGKWLVIPYERRVKWLER